MRSTRNAVRQARDNVDGTAEQSRSEIGSEVDDFREPLPRLRALRGMSAREITTTPAPDVEPPRIDIEAT
ncbi:hypothetical protein [Nocardia spumae]|uniref:hypothetical protein n=1 Tax=Nocardia spumae TaxID=2887190 RepID=UPI001D158CB3|nr:hypothetical protein [Nocardia spumae]